MKICLLNNFGSSENILLYFVLNHWNLEIFSFRHLSANTLYSIWCSLNSGFFKMLSSNLTHQFQQTATLFYFQISILSPVANILESLLLLSLKNMTKGTTMVLNLLTIQVKNNLSPQRPWQSTIVAALDKIIYSI